MTVVFGPEGVEMFKYIFDCMNAFNCVNVFACVDVCNGGRHSSVIVPIVTFKITNVSFLMCF